MTKLHILFTINWIITLFATLIFLFLSIFQYEYSVYTHNNWVEENILYGIGVLGIILYLVIHYLFIKKSFNTKTFTSFTILSFFLLVSNLWLVYLFLTIKSDGLEIIYPFIFSLISAVVGLPLGIAASIQRHKIIKQTFSN